MKILTRKTKNKINPQKPLIIKFEPLEVTLKIMKLTTYSTPLTCEEVTLRAFTFLSNEVKLKIVKIKSERFDKKLSQYGAEGWRLNVKLLVGYYSKNSRFLSRLSHGSWMEFDETDLFEELRQKILPFSPLFRIVEFLSSALPPTKISKK